MPRRMACSMTIDAVRNRTKTVTRRHPDTWENLLPGDELVLIEKGMGLKKGQKQVVIATVEIRSVTVEALGQLTSSEIAREGFDPDEWTPEAWCAWWASGHGWKPEVRDIEREHGGLDTPTGQIAMRRLASRIYCRRIEWEYLT